MVCQTERASVCKGCMSAEYCSKKYQREDYRTHKLLCAEYKRMMNSPRPTKHVKLAFCFRDGEEGEPCDPMIIWVELLNNGREGAIKQVKRDNEDSLIDSSLLFQDFDLEAFGHSEP